MKLTRSVVTIRILLYLGIFIVLNLLAYQLFTRLDFTADKRYTLSSSTKNILGDLDELVTITAYFSNNLPPELSSVRTDFKDMLAEYESNSNNNVVYEFIDPNEKEGLEQEAQQLGIFPLDISAREKDQLKVVRGYMGAVVKLGNQQEVIPVLQSTSGMEYSLSSSIKKLAVTNKPKIGFLQGHGEPGLDRIGQAMQELSTLYEVDTLSLTDINAWSNYKTIVILAPSQPFSQEHLGALDQFLGSGGGLFIGLNAVNGDLQAQQPWDKINTRLENWLTAKGVLVEQAFLTDTKCAQINAQRRQGFFVVNQPLPFYFFPAINTFSDHPITQGLEEIMLQFCSPITLTNTDSTVKTTVLATSSKQSGKEAAPTYFNIEREWTQSDFAYGTQNVAVALEGKIAGDNDSKLVVVSDGDFPLNQGQQRTLPNNVNLLVNGVDWLTDDTGLIELRTRGVESRPIEKQLEDGERSLVKYTNFLLPILIVLAFGFIRFQRRRIQQIKWQAEDYS